MTPTAPPHERAELLLNQRRWDLAEQEARRALETDVDNGHLLAILALALANQDRLEEAQEAIVSLLQVAPNWSRAHFIAAYCSFHRDEPDRAHEAADQAIALDPTDADPYVLKARVHLQKQQYGEAVEMTSAALEHEPENTSALNVRATALRLMGKKEEAAVDLEASLARDPENSFTHSAQGWTLLQNGQRKEAMGHFKESLRLTPDNENAREGMAQALRSSFPPYRLLLAYYFWTQRIPQKAQWAMWIVGYLVIKTAIDSFQEQGNATPAFALAGAYVLFVLSTWTAPTLIDVVLLMHPLGKHILSPDQKKSAGLAAACLGLAAAFAVLALVLGFWQLLALTAGALALLIPVSRIYGFERPRNRAFAGVFSAGMLVLLSWGVIASLPSTPEAGFSLGIIAGVLCMISTWLWAFLE